MLDPTLLERFRTGDEEAFQEVYDACAGGLRPLVLRFFRSSFEREDAIQEVWLHVHRMSRAFDPARGEFLPWLRVLAANRCKEMLRARGRRPEASVALEDDDLVSTETPEYAAGQERLRSAVADFIRGLDADEAAVFRWSLIEERTHDEVAELAGMPARRCKYLRMKLLERAAASPQLRKALTELIDQ